MRDLSFSPTTIVAHSGERLLIRFTNTGTTDHEFMAGRDARSDGGFINDLFSGLEVKALSGINDRHAMSHGGFGLFIEKGRSGGIEFTVPARPGTYEFACFVVGHYEAGMKGLFVIE